MEVRVRLRRGDLPTDVLPWARAAGFAQPRPSPDRVSPCPMNRHKMRVRLLWCRGVPHVLSPLCIKRWRIPPRPGVHASIPGSHGAVWTSDFLGMRRPHGAHCGRTRRCLGPDRCGILRGRRRTAGTRIVAIVSFPLTAPRAYSSKRVGCVRSDTCSAGMPSSRSVSRISATWCASPHVRMKPSPIEST